MAYKNLNLEEMHELSSAWLDPQSEGHKAILKVPILTSQLPLIEAAHKGVDDIMKPAEDPRVAEIIHEEVDRDRRHDSVIRGSHGVLTWMAELVGGDAGDALIGLRDKLIPDGLMSTQKSYRAESTQAKKLDEALKPEVRKRTDSIAIGEGPTAKPMTAYLEEWIKLGTTLGALEDEKGRLLAEPEDEATAASAVNARNYWVRVVNLMVANADMVEIDTKDRAAIFGPLFDAEKKADARQRSSKGKGKAAEEKAAEENATDKAAEPA